MHCPNCKKYINPTLEDLNAEGDSQTFMHYPCGAEILATAELSYKLSVQQVIMDKEKREEYGTIVDYEEEK